MFLNFFSVCSAYLAGDEHCGHKRISRFLSGIFLDVGRKWKTDYENQRPVHGRKAAGENA